MKTKFKIFFSLTLLAVVLFAAVPKVYIHSLLGHNHGFVQPTSETTVDELGDNQDCNFEKFDTPVYYSVFKFILNFLPLKQTKESAFFYKQEFIERLQYLSSPLRGPPVA
ncbi:MAG: hypothetical protein C0448_06405 [Sphingobacteriaceae bacterium]|nr:hypothetical protein [Sphingobacteriaceae bacterium]